jgi:glyoxylase-like metal-dependent hydrolase (beta-lactamase superfamily II)/rhodanese-related sulfurtransferase
MLGVIWMPMVGLILGATRRAGVRARAQQLSTMSLDFNVKFEERRMQVITIKVPHLGNRAHLVHDGSVAVAVDPPRDIDLVEREADRAGLEIVAVAETHIHNDYLSGGLRLARRHGADYLVAAGEEVGFERTPVLEGDAIHYGRLSLSVLATPGHTPQHVSYLASPSDAAKGRATHGALFSGGSLLHGTVGRTDLVDPTRTLDLARAQWRTSRRLGELQPETLLHPTHGFGSFCSSSSAAPVDGPVTIGHQRMHNPVLTTSMDTFVTDLLAGLGPVPAHYAHMAPRNRAGVTEPAATGRRLDADELRTARERGAWLVDLRDRRRYAEGHLRGAISVEHGPQCAVYTGWVTPWGGDVVMLSDDPAQLDTALIELGTIGIEAVDSAILDDDATSYDAQLRRVDWAIFAAQPASPDRVVLDVREPREWRAGRLPGAVNIPVHQLGDRIHEVPPGEVWVHCQAGYRASVAAGLLDRAGRDVVLVDDSFDRVRELGIPLEHEVAA